MQAEPECKEIDGHRWQDERPTLDDELMHGDGVMLSVCQRCGVRRLMGAYVTSYNAKPDHGGKHAS